MSAEAVDGSDWVAAAVAARDRGLAFFDFLTAVDHEQAGFEVVLHLWDPGSRTGELLRTTCPREEPVVPTLTGVFAGAAWHERAAAELFGIRFEGHDTERLLLSEHVEGHPLRKDFLLVERSARPWPGAKDPGESDADLTASTRRRPRPPGVPQ